MNNIFTHRHRIWLLAVILQFIWSGSAFAQQHLTDAQIDSIERQFSLNDIVVTGTRTPKLLKDAPIQTRLITADDIKKMDATNIQDLLQQELPGVEFSYAMNQQVNMNMAGFAGQGVLVLVDGERLAGETMENTDFSRLNMSNVARIEIIKGAASALYGSNAAGGVINIITKDADRPWNLNVNARFADHHEQRYGGSLGVKKGIFSNLLDVNHTTIDTYAVCLNTKDDCDFRSVYGGRTWNFKDRIVLTPADGLKLTGRLGYYFKERLYNVDTPDRYRDFSGGLKGEWQMTKNDFLELSYSYDQYDKSDFQRLRRLDIRDYRNVQHSVRAVYNRNLREKDVLTFGGDFMRDYLDSYMFEAGETRHQYTGDVFAQYDLNIDRHWEIIAAGRWDYFSDNDNSQATGKVGFRYKYKHITLRGGYSGGFRAPTLKEKYMNYDMFGIFYIHGNKDLVSEKSHNFNLSTEYTIGRYNFTVGANYNIVDNKITTSTVRYSSDQDSYIDYINVDRLNVFGAEATAQAKWQLAPQSFLDARLSYNFTHEQTVGGTVTPYSPARPHSLVFKMGWNKQVVKWYGFDLSLTGRMLSKVTYTSMRMYEPFEVYQVTNPTYTLWKVQLANHFKRGITLNIAVDNIFNYGPKVYSYNAPTTLGANLMVGVNIDIDKL